MTEIASIDLISYAFKTRSQIRVTLESQIGHFINLLKKNLNTHIQTLNLIGKLNLKSEMQISYCKWVKFQVFD